MIQLIAALGGCYEVGQVSTAFAEHRSTRSATPNVLAKGDGKRAEQFSRQIHGSSGPAVTRCRDWFRWTASTFVPRTVWKSWQCSFPPSISGAYADTSPEFGLWKSFWRRSDAKMPQVTFNLSDLSQSLHFFVNVQLSPDWLTTRLAPVQTRGSSTAELRGQGGGRLVQGTAKPKGLPQKHSGNPQNCILPPTYRPVFLLLPGQPNDAPLSLNHAQWVRQPAEAHHMILKLDHKSNTPELLVADPRWIDCRCPTFHTTYVKRRKGRRGPTSSSTAGQCLRYVAPVVKGDAESLTEQMLLVEASSAATAFGSAVTVILQRIGARACRALPQRHFDHGVGMPLLCRPTTHCPSQNQHVLREKC